MIAALELAGTWLALVAFATFAAAGMVAAIINDRHDEEQP